MGDEDFFSDDDLDGIPDNTLAELEQNAISSTQRAFTTKAAPQPPRQFQKPINNVSIPTRPATANGNTAWRPPQPRVQQPPPQPFRQQSVHQTSTLPASAPAPSSDYGFDDEDVIDLDEPSMVIQPACGPSTRVNTQLKPSPAAVSHDGRKATLDPETEAAFAAADAELGAHEAGPWAHAPHLAPKADNGIEMSSLQARIAELEAEQARLRQSEQEARNAALAKQGEIAIVRANQEKATKEYERRIAVMQKLHADEAAKVKAELDAGKKEREKMETDNRFLQHDLAQEAERAKRLNGPGKARAAAIAKGKETPRKAKKTGLGDGFDDDEVRVVSPSKSREKSKDATPRHGAKRKRTANDSPVAALSFTQPAEPTRQESNESALVSFEQTSSVTEVREDSRYEFMQRMLRHSPYEGHERTMEALTKHAFPSQPNRSAATALTDELSRPTASDEVEYLPLKLLRAALKLWSRCLAEHYYAPIYLLLDLVSFALYFELSSITAQLIEEAIPLCTKSVDLVASSIFQASTKPAFAASLDWAAQDKLTEEIDVDEVLELLLRLCQAASLVPDRLEDFWRYMDIQLIMLMTSKAQPISQSTTALRILAMSTLSTTFGPICGNAETQVKHETAIVERLTTLIFETPEVPKDEPPYTEEQIAELRNEILKVFKAMCLTDHGGLLLAQHRSAIGRLLRFLHIQVEKLYKVPPSLGLAKSGSKPEPNAHELVVQSVNTTTRIIYHLLRTYDSAINLSDKLNTVNGGYHKFLISMTRIAFSDQLVFEHGIEDEVAEAAHAILDNMLSPEEGEAIGKAVETPRGTKGSERRIGQGTDAEGRDVDGDDETMNDAG